MHGRHVSTSAPATQGRSIHWAKSYDIVSGLLRRLRQATVDLVDLKPGDRVLDVGCGTGSLTMAAKNRVGAKGYVAGIDAAPEMIDFARIKASQAGVQIDYQVGVVEALQFRDGSFNVVLSSLMMHHLPGNLKREGLAEIRRVLKPGGSVLIVDFKRPESGLAHALLPLFFHRSMPVGVQDLAPLLHDTGFTWVESGSMGFALGYIRGGLA